MMIKNDKKQSFNLPEKFDLITFRMKIFIILKEYFNIIDPVKIVNPLNDDFYF